MNGFRTKRGRRQSGKSGCQSEGVMGSEQRELSSEDGDASFQEKLLALIDERPVPKPTQVVKASRLDLKSCQIEKMGSHGKDLYKTG